MGAILLGSAGSENDSIDTKKRIKTDKSNDTIISVPEVMEYDDSTEKIIIQ